MGKFGAFDDLLSSFGRSAAKAGSKDAAEAAVKQGVEAAAKTAAKQGVEDATQAAIKGATKGATGTAAEKSAKQASEASLAEAKTLGAKSAIGEDSAAAKAWKTAAANKKLIGAGVGFGAVAAYAAAHNMSLAEATQKLAGDLVKSGVGVAGGAATGAVGGAFDGLKNLLPEWVKTYGWLIAAALGISLLLGLLGYLGLRGGKKAPPPMSYGNAAMYMPQLAPQMPPMFYQPR